MKSYFCVYLFLALMVITVTQSCAEWMCALVSVWLCFANNSCPFSSQFLLGLVASKLLGPYALHENRHLHIVQGKATALHRRNFIASSQAMLVMKESTQESSITCPNLLRSFSQSWHHQRISPWDENELENRFHLLCAIWKWLFTYESKN